MCSFPNTENLTKTNLIACHQGFPLWVDTIFFPKSGVCWPEGQIRKGVKARLKVPSRPARRPGKVHVCRPDVPNGIAEWRETRRLETIDSFCRGRLHY